MAIQIQSKWQSIYKTNGIVYGLPFVLYLDCHLFYIWIAICFVTGLLFLCIWIAVCFVSGLPFVLYLQNKWQSRYKTNGNPYTKQVAIQMQSKWQSNYKTNGNPETKQMAIHIQNKWQSIYKTNGNPDTKHIWIAICFVSGLPFVL
jgi:hypothetical protein